MNARRCLVAALLAFTASALLAPAAAGGEGAGGWSDEILDIASTIPIQEDGRVKPLITFARYQLLAVSGYTSYSRDESGKISAVGWLLDSLFFPERARKYEVILVPDSELLEAVGLGSEAKKRRDRYSYDQLAAARTEIAAAARRAFQKSQQGVKLETKEDQAMQLQSRLFSLERIFGYLDFARLPEDGFPLDATPGLRELFRDAKGNRLSTVLSRANLLEEALAKLRALPETERNDQSRAEQEAIEELLRLAADVVGGSDGLALIPPAAGTDQITRWLTPTDLERSTLGPIAAGHMPLRFTEEIDLLSLLEEMTAKRDDADAFKAALEKFSATSRRLAEARGELKNVDLEAFIYDFFLGMSPFDWAKWLFVLGFVLVAVSWMVPRNRWLNLSIRLLLGAALVLLVAGIVMRCIVRERPPVTNLYETVLFITAVFVSLALFVEYVNRRSVAIAIAAVFGAAGMFIAERYDYHKAADTMNVLMAVLDTNFWLWTHVTTISIGYAAGLLAAGIGHVYLFGRLFGLKSDDPTFYRGIARVLYGVTCFCLLFAVVGTLLGGIWANDSWGRFWGWDPKENGALLICLWMAATIHARLGRYIRDLGLAIASILGGMVVAFSWWGVNLLGVGLHTYGFASGIFWPLVGFGIAETVVCGLGIFVRLRDGKPAELEVEAAE